MSILLTLSGRHPHYPCFIQHFKRKTWVDGPCSGVCWAKREQRNFQNEGHNFFQVRWQQKNRGKIKKVDEGRHEMHSFTLTLSHSLSFIFSSLSLSPSLSVPRGWGVSCNLSIGFSLARPVTCCPSNLFLFTLIIFHFIFTSLRPRLPVSSFLSFFCLCSSLC